MVNQYGSDVICGGMYRACSTWQYEVAAHLVEEHRGGRRLGYLLSGEYTALVPGHPKHCKAAARNRPGWRVIKAHEGEPRWPASWLPAEPARSTRIATCATLSSR